MKNYNNKLSLADLVKDQIKVYLVKGDYDSVIKVDKTYLVLKKYTRFEKK